MDLIVKPTQACNFACSFCSSSNIDTSHASLPLKKLFTFLDQNPVDTIIVNGGDPLMMPPSYYESILQYIEEHGQKTSLSFTTNLWDFYQHPEKWETLFKQPNVYVTTSFQYGGERKLRNGRPLDESLFCNIMDYFKGKIGYMPMFISVITKKNEKDVLKTVELAKKLHTTCKINPALQSGRSKIFYPLYKAIKWYLDIIDAGLSQYEHNASILSDVMHDRHTICPMNRDCYRTIRCMGPQGELYTCGALHDNHIVREEEGKKTYDLAVYPQREIRKDYGVLKAECFACSMFKICNGCYKTIMDIKDSNSVEEHCAGMQGLKERLQAL